MFLYAFGVERNEKGVQNGVRLSETAEKFV